MSAVELGRLADLLIHRCTEPNMTGSVLFPFVHADVEEKDLDGLMIPFQEHPADHLRRYRPPFGCVALGLVTAGWAAPMDSPVRPSAHPDAQRIVNAVVLGRDGLLVGRLRLPDGSIMDPGRGGQGRVPD